METSNRLSSTLYQIIPSEVCFSCDVCCRFLEADSPLAPIFTKTERQKAVAHGINPALFRLQADGSSAQIQLKRHEDFYICPFFEPETSHCTIIRSVRLTVNSIRSRSCSARTGALLCLAWIPSVRSVKHISNRRHFSSTSAMLLITLNPKRLRRESSQIGASSVTIKTP